MITTSNNEKIREQFAVRLNSACDAAGLRPFGTGRATDLAREISPRTGKATRSAAHKWLSGEAIPTHANIQVLAEVLGVRAEWLQFGQLPRTGNFTISAKERPLTARLLARLMKLEDAKLLNQKLYRALNALLDSALAEL